MKNVVYAVEYTEYERGWGQRPDGVCIYISKEKAFEHKKTQQSYGSSECFVIGSEPYLLEVDVAQYEKLQNEVSGLLWIKHG